MRRNGIRIGLALACATAAVVPLGAGPAAADETTSISLAAAVGSVIQVSGNVAYGTDATGDYELATDPSGDVTAPMLGLDLASLKVRTNVATRRLEWTLGVHDGLPDPIGGPPPVFTAYQVPIMVDGEDWWRWLGAGTAGTAFANPGKWTGLCHNEVNGASGGWSCPGTLAGSGTFNYSGSITASGVTWSQPFGQMKPSIGFGSRIEPGSALCGAPCSFAFVPGLALGGLAPYDTMSFWDPYKVPGEVKLGIAPAGIPPTSATFTTDATFAQATGAITGALTAPSTPGDYTVWARTCFGLADAPTCVDGSTDITI